MTKRLAVTFLTILALGVWSVQASAQSGQRAIGRVTVEPAVDDATGNLIFLLTPDKVPMPSRSNPRAAAPMFLPVYPTTSTINPATLDCQPTNCDHVNVLPFAVPGYSNGGAACQNFGLPDGGCSLVLGHDHLVGMPHTGDFNVAWHVTLVIFTPQGIAAGKANSRALTLQSVTALVANGDAFFADTPITFNCSVVSAATYWQGVPLTF